jgi:hypothetical protein
MTTEKHSLLLRLGASLSLLATGSLAACCPALRLELLEACLADLFCFPREGQMLA